MEIREILVSDVDLYRAQRLEMLHNSPDAFLTTADEYALRGRELEVRRIRDNNTSNNILFIGAFEAGELLGSMGVVRQVRPKKRHIATVVAVYVAPSARGRGIGGQLLDTLIDHARNTMDSIELLQLGVASNNQPAIKLYKSRGFASYGIERAAMKDGNRYIDENHMWLNLTNIPPSNE